MTEIPSQRIALVTGASRGIGRAAALALAKSGAHVIACAKNAGGLEALDDEIRAATGEGATLIPFDLIDGGAWEKLPEAVFQRFGRLDCVVHSAAILGLLTPVSHTEPKDFGRVISVNLTASYRLIAAIEPLLRRSAAGRAVFLTSSVASKPRAFWGMYAASKAALECLARTWADEIDDTPIRIAILDPGAMRTRMRAEAFPGEDPMSLPDPQEIGPLVVELCDPARTPPAETVKFSAWKAAAPALRVSG